MIDGESVSKIRFARLAPDIEYRADQHGQAPWKCRWIRVVSCS